MKESNYTVTYRVEGQPTHRYHCSVKARDIDDAYNKASLALKDRPDAEVILVEPAKRTSRCKTSVPIADVKVWNRGAGDEYGERVP